MRCLRNLAAHGRRAGITLIEAVAAIVVLGIAIPPLAGLFSSVAALDAQLGQDAAAFAVAENFMEEIASKAFEDPDLATGSFGTEEALRVDFDDVDDYDGYFVAPVERLDGTVVLGHESLSVLIEVRLIDQANDPYPDLGGGVVSIVPSLEAFKQVRVRVFWPDGDHQLMTLRAPGLQGSGSEVEPDPEPPDGPLDELEAPASVKHGKDKFQIDLTNETNEYKTLASIALSASTGHPALKKVKLDKPTLFKPNPPAELPTGDIDVTSTSWAKRTFEPYEELRLKFEFDDKPSGSIDYELVLRFDDGGVSTVLFTIDW